MFANVPVEEPDAIMSLQAEFAADRRLDLLNLGIGVYRAADGTTPILASVREAERILAVEEATKAYLSPLGDPAFNGAMTRLALGESGRTADAAAIQTPGGAGALALAAAFVARTEGRATILVPRPTWVNHAAIFRGAGLEVQEYPYFDPETGGVRLDAMLERLERAEPGGVVLLHGCCHNPSGADVDADGWRRLAEVLGRRGLLPLVDLAYQGFAGGLEEDARGLRILAGALPELFVAMSCSKNFAIYRERAGCLVAVAANSADAERARSRLTALTRATYSMPPNHGAALVRTILGDAELSGLWRAELDGMRTRIADLRADLVEALRARTGGGRFDFIGAHRGMFSLLGTSVEQARRLRREHGIYVVDDGRMNVAGLARDQVEWFAAAVVAVTASAG